MKIWASMVTRNEAGRYLDSSIRWLSDIVDGIAVLDDGSTDETVKITKSLGARVGRTPKGVPSFLQNESRFRQMALLFLDTVFHPKPEDWILSVDADEFLVAKKGKEAEVLRHFITCSEEVLHHDGARFRVAEVFDVKDQQPMVRTDGYWGNISAIRLFRWQGVGEFEDRALAGGSCPAYVEKVIDCRDLTLLHFGYATRADRSEKYARYAGREGHGYGHIASILQPPTLAPWKGKVPVV